MTEPVRKKKQTLAENLREYWREHLVHWSVAGLAGYLLTGDLWVAGAAIIAAQNVRQVCGFWEKRDTVSHDLAVIQAGLLSGVVLGWLL